MASELRMDLLRWQEEVLQDKTRFKVICAGRRLGKTRFAIVQSIIKALECKDVSASVMLIAPTSLPPPSCVSFHRALRPLR